MPKTQTEHVLHLFIISTRTGDTTVFLLEREPGVVEFPQICATDKELDDEPELVRRIQSATGMDVAISGFLDPPAGTEIQPPHSKFLIGRVVSGTPRPGVPHVGWEWRSGNNLLSLQFLPRLMVDELRVFMNS
ncbi:MAG TPA: hypothetical protein VH916_14575 [Dehalococcoidia bacterium]|jgi:hypothetical protein